ncbi:DUF4189 domain-containing protein [Nocardia huaxiensis]|uniref:DUF4189 domain-containing protein n=1 Tax=Nocardia huaxiensis TaxID=2755382 RepID=A0A7D6VDA6_9NOCA|nr:DUF4189 domain-containing protein [Nocardia huaxiensis]QLY32273.1 DUF4189 domain-containing protein [Nocardia huaxiensis]UFS94023.1 DUF4189 domain-containing protein [Nocardia huaxiensis]
MHTRLAFAAATLAATALLLPAAPAQATTYWGAIATDGSRGAMGYAWNYTSQSSARTAALNQCGRSCKVLTTFTGCGAVSHSDSANRYTGGHGATRAAAEDASRWDWDSRVVRSVCNG